MHDIRDTWQSELKTAEASKNEQNIKHYSYLLKTYTESYFKNINNISNILPKDGDLTLLVLKGHLLIEQQIRSFVYNHFPNQDALKGVFKETSSLISVGKAYCDSQCDDTMKLWDCFAKLNNIRNHMAHNINQTGLEHKIEDFLKVSQRFITFTSESSDLFQRVYDAINAIYQKALYLSTTQETKFQQYIESRT